MTDLPGRHSAGLAAAGVFAVTRLALRDFRNFARAELHAPPGPVLLLGENGAGKTNLLEALSLLAPGRGLRRARLAEMERRRALHEQVGCGWAVSLRVRGPDCETEVLTTRQVEPERDNDGAGEKRSLKLNGAVAANQALLSDLLAMLWLTPEMERVFAEGAAERRRFLDRLVAAFVPAHVRNLATFDQAMRERNFLLREERFDPHWLSALERTMAANGVAIAAARRQTVARLGLAAEASRSGFAVPGIAVEGDVERDLEQWPALEAEDRYCARLADARSEDAAAGRTLAGPHRSDFVVVHPDKLVSAQACSTGERKVLLIALVLACARLMQLQRGAPPILLLDELAAHLDGDRRRELFAEICALGGQVWMSGTDFAPFAPLAERAAIFEVRGGTVAAAAQPAHGAS
jgi:DNA replication and repair protein RecF